MFCACIDSGSDCPGYTLENIVKFVSPNKSWVHDEVFVAEHIANREVYSFGESVGLRVLDGGWDAGDSVRMY